MDIVNHNVTLSVGSETYGEGQLVAPISQNDTTNTHFIHDKICSSVPVGPLSPTAATDDSSQTDIGNVLSLEVPDAPSNMSQSQESEVEECSVLSNEWHLVNVSEPDNSIVLETVDVIDAVPSDMDSNSPRLISDLTRDDLSNVDLQELRRLQQDEAVKESNKEPFDPMRMLRKGGVAVLGGTLVGVGLIMIPLPTPFGVVVASSGMAVLSAEFEGAKVLNEKITETTKKHWDAARANIIKGIEEMEGSGRPSVIDGPENKGSNDLTGDGDALTDDADDSDNDDDEVKQGQNDSQQKSTQPNIFDQWKRSTGAYLSRNLVPILKRYEADVGSIPDADNTVQSETETISDMEQNDDLATDSNAMAAAQNQPVEPLARQ